MFGKLVANFGETLLKVAKDFLGPEMPLCVLARHTEEAKKVLGYLVAKNFLGFLCAHQNDNFRESFSPVFGNHIFCCLPRVLAISHVNKTFTVQ